MNKNSILILILLIKLINSQNTTNNTIVKNITNNTTVINSNNQINTNTRGSVNATQQKLDMMFYCDSLTEAKSPKIIDCTSIDFYCCHAYYTIMNFSFTTCFYNEYEDKDASAFFKDAIGSISSSPFMNSTVTCDSFLERFSYLIIMIIAITIY